MDDEELRFAGDAIADADLAVTMTGAGVSTASGIPDFRGSNGLWERYDPADFHISRFEADPTGFWRDRLGMVELLYGTDVEPNAAHEALAALERDGHVETVLTQNVDGLHQAAGSEDVIELHGNGQRVVCRDCRARYDADAVHERVEDGEIPPRCEQCNSVLKPDVVLFGEQLPDYAYYRAHAAAQRCDAFVVVGSSLEVEPAASIPEVATDRGATLVVVNLEETPLSSRAEYDFRADATEALPRLYEAATEY